MGLMGLQWHSRSREEIKEHEELHNKNRIYNLFVVKLKVVRLCKILLKKYISLYIWHIFFQWKRLIILEVDMKINENKKI